MKKFSRPASVVAAAFFLLLMGRSVPAQESNPPAPTTNPPAADEGPTIKETQDWLKEKLQYSIEYTDSIGSQTNYKGMGATVSKEQRRFTLEFKDVKFDGCTLTWTTSVKKFTVDEDGDSREGSDSYDHTAFLKDVDPASVRVVQHVAGEPGGGTKIKGVTTPDVWNLLLTDKTPDEFEYIYNVFMFKDREMAKRVAKAFQHAVTLCGGKVQPF